MKAPVWKWVQQGEGPLVASAIHDGHDLRPEVAAQLGLPEEDRRREEDPFTARWTEVAPHRLLVFRSRFEVDLNRPRDQAVYSKPGDCWNLPVWPKPPSEALIAESLREYDDFYSGIETELRDLERRHGRFVLFDIHSYNHRRNGAAADPEDPQKNPEVNVGTASVDRGLWGGLVDRFVSELRAGEVLGVPLDVRENVKFFGGNFPRWVNATFAGRGCALALEFKKTFMNEWTGEAEEARLLALGESLAKTVPGLLEELERIGRPR